MEMHEFILYTKDEHLTISDIKKMLPGEQIDVVIWDGNYEEYWIWKNAKSGKLYNPKVFFRENKHKIIYKGDMIWDIHFPDGKTIEHPIHFDISILDKAYSYFVSNDKIMLGRWREPKDGKVGVIDNNKNIKYIHWTDLPENTKVGWQGSIMLWDKLRQMPNVYFVDKFQKSKI